jgi:hypothetical protein
MVLAIVSTLPFLVAAALAVRNYDAKLMQITYGQGGKFVPILITALLLSMAPSFVGFVLGWSSAGRRRNEQPTFSWIGFFVGGFIFTLNFILLIAFWKLRMAIPLG